MDEISNINRPFLTTGQIVDAAGVHPNTVAVWRATKKIIPRDRIAVAFLYDRKEIVTFLVDRLKKKKIKNLPFERSNDPMIEEVRNEIRAELAKVI